MSKNSVLPFEPQTCAMFVAMSGSIPYVSNGRLAPPLLYERAQEQLSMYEPMSQAITESSKKLCEEEHRLAKLEIALGNKEPMQDPEYFNLRTEQDKRMQAFSAQTEEFHAYLGDISLSLENLRDFFQDATPEQVKEAFWQGCFGADDVLASQSVSPEDYHLATSQLPDLREAFLNFCDSVDQMKLVSRAEAPEKYALASSKVAEATNQVNTSATALLSSIEHLSPALTSAAYTPPKPEVLPVC